MRLRYLSTIMVLLSALAVSPLLWAQAAEDDIYTIRKLEIQAQGKSGEEARVEALKQVETQGFDTLMRRLLKEEEYKALPVIKQEDITNAVLSYEINNEKVSKNSYRAEYTVSFSKEQVASLLEQHEFTADGVKLKQTLVVPVYVDAAGQQHLWEQNPWLEAWRKQEVEAERKRFILPVGDLEDIAALAEVPSTISDRSFAALLAERYTAPFVLVSFFEEGPVADGPKNSTRHILVLPNNETHPKAYSEIANMDGHVNDVIAHFYGMVKEFSKQNLEVVHAISARARFLQFSDWMQIQNMLRATEGISGLSVSALQANGATVNFEIKGKQPAEILLTLRESGLKIEEISATEWMIER